jgi:hypothetical protein
MKYLPTAFENLEFAFKLLAYAQDGNIDWVKLDEPHIRVSEDGRLRINLERSIFSAGGDPLILIENNCSIAFGAAAITLNRSIEEAGHKRVNAKDIKSENEQCVELITQIRNAFAHDIAEPRWHIVVPQKRRMYEFGGMKLDLTNLHEQNFAYEHVNGVEGLFQIRAFAIEHLLPKN